MHQHNENSGIKYDTEDKLQTVLAEALKGNDARNKKAADSTQTISLKTMRDAAAVVMLVSGITAMAVTSTILLIAK